MDERDWSSWTPTVVPYAVLLRLFIDRQMTGKEFEVVFFLLYKNDPTLWSSELFDVLDGFFADVDDFSPDPRVLAAVGGLTEEDLRVRAAETYERLAGLAKEPGR